MTLLFVRMEKMMMSTIAPAHKERFGYSTFKIAKLERVQHPEHWGLYYLRKKEIARNNEENREMKIEGVL